MFKKFSTILSITVVYVALVISASVNAGESVNLWPEGKMPTVVEGQNTPTYEVFMPENKTSDTCVILFPGGAYQFLDPPSVMEVIVKFLNERGITAVVVRYRVPRPQTVAKHVTAWQDAQRAVRIVRSKATELGVHPEKIGCLGNSAGGHLALMVATTSQTRAYAPIDEIDDVPCHVNFAVPVYPAYVLEDGKDGPNREKGNDSTLVSDFVFDAKTPPMCLIHGDADVYSPMASVAVYHKLRTLNIPAELHIYALIHHGFAAAHGGPHHQAWLNRVYEWMKVMKY